MLLGLVRWVWTPQINARRARDEAVDLAQGSLPSGQLILRRGSKACPNIFERGGAEIRAELIAIPENGLKCGFNAQETQANRLKAPAGLDCAGVRLWNAVHSEYEIADEPSGFAECLRMYRPRRGFKSGGFT
jgi:hypothetical protein